MSRRIERTAQRISLKFNTNYDLVVELLEILDKDQAIEILKMQPNDLRQTARVNLTQVSRKEAINRLKEENIRAVPIDTIPEGIEIKYGQKKLGSSLSYLRGDIMPQGLGSMVTVDVLDPQPGERILDMAAAPGGKSCFIGERLQGEGQLYVNDPSASRFRSLLFNITRHGLENVIYFNRDGKKLEISGLDRILLDAPCTGGGLLVSKPHRRVSKDFTDSLQLQRLQISLLQKALSLLEPGGVCVYSTCAISPLENEHVVEKFTNQVKFDQLPVIGIDATMSEEVIGKRLYPHIHGCDGFFIVRMVKL